MTSDFKQKAHIDDWTEFPLFPTGSVLVGRVTGHPRQGDFYAELQQTTRLVRLDRENKIAETKNTIYTLGKENKDRAD